MKRKIRWGNRVFFGLLAMLVIAYAEVPDSLPVVWVDRDMENIPEPRERESIYAHSIFQSLFIEPLNQQFDVPRWTRKIAGKPKQSTNVNALDEVADSSWYTNRHHLRPMTMEELVRGPNRSNGPDFESAVIISAKTSGVTPGLQVKDAGGDKYLVKFDNVDYPELQSGAEVISTKILYAAGYNVPENYIANLHPDQLRIDDKVQIEDRETGKKRPFTKDDLTDMLLRVARRPDGSIRVLASKFLEGAPKGPFPQAGIREDDPNDRIMHEHRRELRALRVIASWINHWDTKEDNALDMYMEENGRKFLRHYLIDFGSTLGGGQSPMEYSHGRTSGFDTGAVLKELFSFGLYTSAEEKKRKLVSRAVGLFSNEEFNPEGWRPSLPMPAFENMTDEDAFWATRIILSFTAEELQGMIGSAQYSRPEDSEYLLATLLERREVIARHWLYKTNPLTDFRVESQPEGLVFTFKDLESDLDRGQSSYQFEVRVAGVRSDKLESRTSRIALDTLVPNAHQNDSSNSVEVTIRTTRSGAVSDPVRVYLRRDPAQKTFHISQISRG